MLALRKRLQSKRLQSEIEERSKQLKEFDFEIRRVEKEKNNALSQYKVLIQEQEDAELPEALTSHTAGSLAAQRAD